MENFCAYIGERTRSKGNSILFRVDDPSEREVAWNVFEQEMDATACFLKSCQIQEKDKILCLVSRPLSWLKLFFAALKIGAIPIVGNFRDRFFLQGILSENSPAYVCSDEEKELEPFLSSSSKVILLNDFASLEKYDIYALKDADDILCALYTSGSMGKPKYIEKSYRNLITELQFLKNLLKMQQDDVVLSLVPNVHIYGMLFGLLLPIMAGAQAIYTNCLLPREVMKIARDKNVNFLIGAPIHYQAFIETNDPDQKMSHLKLAISSGGPLPARVAQKFFRLTGVNILEIYGSTETGGIAYRLWDGMVDSPSLQLFPYIEKKIEAQSEINELVIQSPAISSNVLMAENRGWHHTGDFVRFEEGNRFKIVGRQEQIMKVGGKRISTTQLEEEIKTIPGIKDVAVVRMESSSYRESGVAFVEIQENANLIRSEIQKEFQKRSANYRSIQDIIILDKIPRNPNGKILYSHLRINKTNPKIGMIIPTYNHGLILRKVVLSALEYISDILVVVDGSTDNTMEVLQNLPIKILAFPKNRGKGRALKTGFQEAKKLGWNYAITMDSDGQHKAQDIPQFLKAISENPEAIVVGDRNMELPSIPSSSKFGKKFTNFWLKVETGLSIADGQSGFRAYPIHSINAVHSWFNRYEFEVEILARSAWKGIPIISIPVQVDYHPEGKRISHFRPFMDNFRTTILNTILVTIRILMLVHGLVKKVIRKVKASCKV